MNNLMLFQVVMMTLIVALLAAFLLLAAYKTGIVEQLQVRGNKLVSEMAQCDFCMCWWLSLAVSIVFLVVTMDRVCIGIPFLATPLARWIKG